MARYNIYYTQYNIIANDYIPYIRVIETDDVYHEIGKMICTSLEEIENIRYTQPRASKEECEKLWLESGYEKINDTLWRFGEKCDCFCEEQRIKGWLDGNTPITEPITVCNGTRERDECTCGGDKSKCDFYAKDYSYGY